LREQLLVTGPSAPPLMLCLDSRVAHVEPEPVDMEGGGESSRGSSSDTSDNADSPDPETSRSKGSFNWDREKGGFNIEWANLAEFDMWRREEERIYSIELVGSTSRTGGKLWSRRQLYVCGREASGGGTYEKKHPERERKIATKKSGCRCCITIKLYPHTSTVLGRYVAEHDHEIGFANIAYTRLSGASRERIKAMLTQKIDRYEIVSS
jgi:hypothetical protein